MYFLEWDKMSLYRFQSNKKLIGKSHKEAKINMTKTLQTAKALSVSEYQIQDPFWTNFIDLVRNVVVPYQWEALNDRIPGAEPSRAIRNFKIAAGEEQGDYYGMVFQDSDVAKWLEAVGYLLTSNRNPELEEIADSVIDTISKAQQEDGYLNTYYTLKEPGKRWTNLAECHELYCAGHMIEAAVSYYQATGKRKLLDVVCKFADHISDTFGTKPGQIRGYDGHQEIELALMKLYEVTGNNKYVELCRFFLQERGSQPHFYDSESEKRDGAVHFGKWIVEEKEYSQSHEPITKQETAVGHAVRFAYMCTAMAHLAGVTGDREMLEASRRLWNNMASKRTYITGAIGSQSHGEAFSFDYDLPNDTAYAETCASCGLVFYAHRMLQLEPDSRYADMMERALYNTVIGGMSADGKSFFYVNPLESHPQACADNRTVHHVKPVRQGWFGCACCPPNVARLLASLGQYVYTFSENTVYAHLYVGGEASINLEGGKVVLRQEANLPWNGDIKFTVVSAETGFELALRIPEWSDQTELFVNGSLIKLDSMHRGYLIVKHALAEGDVVELKLSMPVNRMKSHPLVRQTGGKTAIQRGPLVYCLEEADNGKNLHQLLLTKQSNFKIQSFSELGTEMISIKAEGIRRASNTWGETLYRRDFDENELPADLIFIPYFAWANRGVGEMRVWVEEN